jgi:hypothetical protein
MSVSIRNGASTGGGQSATGVPSDIPILRLLRPDPPAPRPSRPGTRPWSPDRGPGLGIVARAGRDEQGSVIRWRGETARDSIRRGVSNGGPGQHRRWPCLGRPAAMCGSALPRGHLDGYITGLDPGHPVKVETDHEPTNRPRRNHGLLRIRLIHGDTFSPTAHLDALCRPQSTVSTHSPRVGRYGHLLGAAQGVRQAASPGLGNFR